MHSAVFFVERPLSDDSNDQDSNMSLLDALMKRFLITAPFTYRFGASIRYFQAGDVYSLNPEEYAQELEYWLSDHFEYKNFIHALDPEPAAKPIIFSQVPEDLPGEAERIALEIEVEAPQPFVDDSQAPEEIITEEPPKYSLPVRKKELESLPWGEVKGIAENLGIEYKNKSDAIELILDKEF